MRKVPAGTNAPRRSPRRRLSPVQPAAAVGLANDVVQWQRLHGRHGLPWQEGGDPHREESGDPDREKGGDPDREEGSDPCREERRDPYRVWLSEVMLQQTQVGTVIPYFNAFVQAFPRVADLAAAPADQVMALWSGLGYYGRARNLHAAAKRIMACHGGSFPGTAAELAGLPGVGRSTAAAIAVFAFGERAAILDGNVKRVLCRVFAIDGYPGDAAVAHRLWAHAQAELPPLGTAPSDLVAYTQGLMDLGATLCTRVRPDCLRCPLRARCGAHRTDAVARYPAARPRRPVPVREVDMLMLCRDGAVLIEQRPPAGVWGGLWSLPEMPAGTLPDRVLISAGVSLRAGELAPYARFEHAFSHFRMKARVWRSDADQARAGSRVSQPAATRWLALADAAGAPLPRPVKSLLQSVADRTLADSIVRTSKQTDGERR